LQDPLSKGGTEAQTLYTLNPAPPDVDVSVVPYYADW
jgi:hypothetical protein